MHVKPLFHSVLIALCHYESLRLTNSKIFVVHHSYCLKFDFDHLAALIAINFTVGNGTKRKHPSFNKLYRESMRANNKDGAIIKKMTMRKQWHETQQI